MTLFLEETWLSKGGINTTDDRCSNKLVGDQPTTPVEIYSKSEELRLGSQKSGVRHRKWSQIKYGRNKKGVLINVTFSAKQRERRIHPNLQDAYSLISLGNHRLTKSMSIIN